MIFIKAVALIVLPILVVAQYPTESSSSSESYPESSYGFSIIELYQPANYVHLELSRIQSRRGMASRHRVVQGG